MEGRESGREEGREGGREGAREEGRDFNEKFLLCFVTIVGTVPPAFTVLKKAGMYFNDHCYSYLGSGKKTSLGFL